MGPRNPLPMQTPRSRLRLFSRGLAIFAAGALAALLPTLPVSAFPTSNQTPWLLIGMGGNGFTDDFDPMNAPAAAKARSFLAAGVDERPVHPTGKAVVKIPLRLAVTNEDERSHGGSIVAQSHSVSKILVRCP